MTARAPAVAAVFVANGLGGPSFLPRLPERQADLALSDAALGAVLVGMAVGALVASPVAGRAIGRFGSRPVLVASALALAATLWTAGAAPTPVLLFLALTLVGAADAGMDIAMNANGAALERRAGASLMHRLHGAWSLGALAGAGLAAAAAGLGIPLAWQLAGVGAVVAATTAGARRRLVTGDARRPVAGAGAGATPCPRPATPPGRALAVLGAAAVGGAIVEGAPTDWSALRLERMGTGAGTAALGVAAFMAGMLAARLGGDRLTDRYGGAAVLRAGMALVGAGLVVGALVDEPAVFALGLVLAGAGSSAFFPLAFSAAGAGGATGAADVAPGAGAATVSLAARIGFMAEPPVMGALAEGIGLRWAFAAVAGVAVALAAAAPRIAPTATRLAPAP